MLKPYYLLLSFSLIILIISFPTNVLACCAGKPLIEEEIETSEAIFAGKVIGIKEKRNIKFQTTPFELFSVKKQILFEVTKTWKGVSQSQIIIGTGISSIGYDFKVGNEYLVYANQSDSNQLETIICDRTKELSLAEEELATLGDGKKPKMDINLEDKFKSNPFYLWLIIFGILTSIIYFTRLIWKR